MSDGWGQDGEWLFLCLVLAFIPGLNSPQCGSRQPRGPAKGFCAPRQPIFLLLRSLTLNLNLVSGRGRYVWAWGVRGEAILYSM